MAATPLSSASNATSLPGVRETVWVVSEQVLAVASTVHVSALAIPFTIRVSLSVPVRGTATPVRLTRRLEAVSLVGITAELPDRAVDGRLWPEGARN
jgi:hypothetical protein